MKTINLSEDKLNIGNNIAGGAGGDILYFVSDLDKLGLPVKKGILKIFKTHKSKKMPDEMKIHLNFTNDVKLKHYTPIIYCKGLYNSNGGIIEPGIYHYFIIENVNDSPGNKFTGELYSVVRIICDKLTLSNNRNYKIFICNLLWQLSLILYTLLKKGYTHCDIHPKNIFVREIDKSNLNYPSITLNSKGPMYAISIIDFGESSKKKRKCSQLRKKSKVLAKVGCSKWKKYTISRNVGANISALYHLPVWTKKRRSKSHFNSDIWFLFSLLKSLKLFPSDQLKLIEKFIDTVDQGKGWWIKSNSSKNNIILLLKFLMGMFRLVVGGSLNFDQVNKNGKSATYSLIDKHISTIVKEEIKRAP